MIMSPLPGFLIKFIHIMITNCFFLSHFHLKIDFNIILSTLFSCKHKGPDSDSVLDEWKYELHVC